MSLLVWRAAEDGDRAALQQFTCTVRAERRFGERRPYHPKPWELDVQSGVRTLQPVLPADQALMLGMDGGEIGAVCLLADQGDAMVIKIQAIAVSVRYRGQGGRYADEAMEAALAAAVERGKKAGNESVLLVGWVDPNNNASKRMNQRAGFMMNRITSSGLEEWVLELDLKDANEPGADAP